MATGGAVNNTPDNVNFLSPIGFNFIVKKLPNVNYFLQSVNIPNVAFGQSTLATPLRNIPIPGDEMTFGPLFITFKVDEDMKNYLELFNWMMQLGFPESTKQSQEIYKAGQDPSIRNQFRDDRPVSDATLTILSSAMQPNLSILFQDVFPTNLSDLTFSTQENSVNYIECQANFEYRSFKIFDIASSGNDEVSIKSS